jgi:hypothetical protein
MTLPPDIERYVERAFPDSDRAAVLELLGNAVIHDGQPAGPRLLRCALISSRGDLARLRTQIEHLKIDFRDVILEGEYVPKPGGLEHIRNLNEPFGDEA